MDLLVRNSRIRLSVGQVFWREIGSGLVLVFLHGSWSDSSQWLPIVEHLSSDYHCFVPDLLGFGDSERPNIHYSVDLEVEFLAQFLEALKLRHVYLIGHSLGGWIATSYALKYPDRVKGLVLLAPVGVRSPKPTRHGWWTRWLRIPQSLIFRLLRSLQPLTKLVGWHKKTKQSLQQQQQLLHPTASQLLFQRRQSEIKAELLHDRLNELRVPVLILQGGKDDTTAIAESQAYADLTPTATLQIISYGENDLPQTSPDAVAEYIRGFVSS